MSAPPRKPGRPPIIPGERTARYQIRLAPSIVAQLRAIGGGSVSVGIYRLLANSVEPPPAPPGDIQ